jgi:large subunit ribosomal protein L6
MFAPARRRCAHSIVAAASKPQTTSLPAFLLPALHRPTSRTFSCSAPCASKIGSAPLSVPPGVTFNVVAPSAKGRGSRVQAMSTVHIKGPLGELSMEVPPYLNIAQDEGLSGPTLTIADTTDAKQKAMWGACYLLTHPLICCCVC